MIDLRLLRDDPDTVRASQRARGEDDAVVDRVLDADVRRRAAIADFERLRAEQKSRGKDVARASGEEKQKLLAGVKHLSEQVKSAQVESEAVGAEFEALMRAIPNVVEDGVPPGGEADFVVLKEVGAPPPLPAGLDAWRDHLELGEALAAIDVERGAKVAGSRFYFLTGVGARLELALLNMAVAKALAAGFTPMITPTLVKPEVMAGTGFLGAHAAEVYHLQEDDLYLTGTSEVALAGYHADEILDLSAGPKRYAGWSACYRREAGSYGKDTRGIIRVHQFHKVEMFSYCRPEDAAAEHRRLLGIEEEMLAAIEVPYRVIDTAAGDLGSSAARKFDCEAWVPSQGAYRELTSTSNCTTFQARRLGVRERVEGEGTRPVATLNGTLGTTRWIVAILENHQQADGSVRVPEALRPFLGLDVPHADDLTGRREVNGGLEGVLVALDVDGTIVDHDEALSDRVRVAVHEVAAAGAHVVIATGRSLHGTLPVVQRLGLEGGYLVCSNGAVTVRLDPSRAEGYQVLALHTFDPSAVAGLLHEHLPTGLFAVEVLGRGFKLTAPFPDGELTGEIEVVPFAELFAEPVMRVVVRSPEHSPAEFTDLVEQVGLHGVAYSVGWTAWLDLAPDGITKASALEDVRLRLEVPHEATLAVGDGRNDVEMLRWAARGIAMGNAPEEVKAAADAVTGHVDDDGLADVLEPLLAARSAVRGGSV